MAWREDAHISTVRVRGAGQDTPALRLGLSNLLGGMDFRPPGVPPSAVLIVRRLDDPLPGRFARGRGPTRVDRVWERALQQRLTDIYRQAARPVQGRLPPNAEAVLFADKSEMLAGLALDLSRGEAAWHWWWRVPLRRLPSGVPSERLGVLLCREAARVPAVLHYLSAWKQAETVVRVLSAPHAEAILQAVGVAFGVAGLGAASARRTAGTPAHPVEDTQRPGSRMPGPVRLPWTRHLAPDVVPGALEPVQQSLLGVSLMLQRAPALVRQPAFVRALQQWHAQVTAPVLESPEADRSRPAGQPDVPQTRAEPPISDVTDEQRTEDRSHYDPVGAPEASENLQPATSPLDHAEAPFSLPTLARAQDEDPAATPRSVLANDVQAGDPRIAPGQHRDPEHDVEAMPAPTKPRQPLQASPGLSDQQQATDAPGLSPSWLGEEQPLDSAPRPDAPTRSSSQAKAAHQILSEGEEASEMPARLPFHERTNIDFEEGVETQLGGFVYLLNLMLHLDLPGCFEAAWRLDGQVRPWGVLEVLARAFVPPDRIDLAGDPLWACLAALDDREAGTLPGANYRESNDYRLPEAWLAQAGLSAEGRYAWATLAGRLRVWSEEGFVVAALPRDAEAPAAQTRAMLEALDAPTGYTLTRRAFDAAPLETLAGPFVAGLNPSLASWVALVMPFLRYRLGRALALPPAEQTALAEMLLLYAGRLYLTSSHVDLVMPLEAISMPIRLAGLDRDPGWLPSFGRVVYLHFE